MAEKIAVEVDAKICFGKKYKNWQKQFFYINAFFTTSTNVGPNLKPYSEKFLSEFYENCKQKLPSTIND